MAKFGGNEFTEFSVPLVFEGRYFVLEPGDTPSLSVFVERDGKPAFEVLHNEPSDGNPDVEVSKTPPGIVTISDSSGFVYKVRPGSETGVMFGTLKGEELDVRITDKEIRVGTNVLQNNTFTGQMAGVVIRSDGGMGIGAPLPDIVRSWLTER